MSSANSDNYVETLGLVLTGFDVNLFGKLFN